MAKCKICDSGMSVMSTKTKASSVNLDLLKRADEHFEDGDICDTCAIKKISNIRDEIKTKVKAHEANLKSIYEKLDAMPHMTLSPPQSWDFQIKGMPSGHSVIGTGPLSTIASAFTDLFGIESNAYADKIKLGEDRAIASAKINALKMGATALVGCSLSVSEATSGHGMLMISFFGTAIYCEQHTESKKLLREYGEYKCAMDHLLNKIKHIGIDMND